MSNNPRAQSVVPRGFSRFYVLYLLKEKPMTGKQIIDEAERRSNGTWKPSPGLVYPLLGKLLGEELVQENEGGAGYSITPRGEKVLEQYLSSNPGYEHLLTPLTQLGALGKFVAQDISDQLITVMKGIRENISKATSAQRARYRDFLRSELERIEKEDEKVAGEESSSSASVVSPVAQA